jgi:hypothetical protein
MIILLMHVLIIFILILGLVITRMHSPRLNEGFDDQYEDTVSDGSTGSTGSTGPIGGGGDKKRKKRLQKHVPFVQPPLYSGVW